MDDVPRARRACSGPMERLARLYRIQQLRQTHRLERRQGILDALEVPRGAFKRSPLLTLSGAIPDRATKRVTSSSAQRNLAADATKPRIVLGFSGFQRLQAYGTSSVYGRRRVGSQAGGLR